MANIRSTSSTNTLGCLLLSLLYIAGCGTSTPPPRSDEVALEAEPGHLCIKFDRPLELDGLTLYDDHDVLLQQISTAGRRHTFDVPFNWRPDRTYRVALHLGTHTLNKTWHSPATAPPVLFELEAPLGQTPISFGSQTTTTVLVPHDGALTIALVATSGEQSPTEIQFTCEADPALILQPADDAWQRTSPHTLTASHTLSFAYDYLQVAAQVRLQPGADVGHLTCRAVQTIDGQPHEQQLTLELRTATPAQLASWIVPQRVVFPADAQGRNQPERLSDSVVLPNQVWSTIRSWFRPSDAVFNYHAPYAYHALDLRNNSDVSLNVVVASDVHVAGTDSPLMEFAPPLWASPEESPTSEHLLRLPPGETVAAVLPLFVRPHVRPGTYERTFRVYLVGSDRSLATIQAPLYVVRGNAIVSSVVVLCLATSLIAWGTLGVGSRRLLHRLDNDALAVIATVASLHFVVSYLARVGGDILASVTGPFNLFVAGVANEGLTCLMLALIVVLLPRPGTATVSGVTVFLLNAMFTGQFGLVDLLFVTVSVLLTEAALALAGITTRHLPAGGQAMFSVTLRLATAVGLANAITWYAQFCLMQVLLRLYFADWYVVAVCLLTGFVYGGAGAAVGATLGYRLRRTAR